MRLLKISIAILLLLSISGCTEFIADVYRAKQGISPSDYKRQKEREERYNSSNIKKDAYGKDIHSDESGRPVKLVPQGGGNSGEQLKIKENTYGPGVHSDQYGRPVKAVSAY